MGTTCSDTLHAVVLGKLSLAWSLLCPHCQDCISKTCFPQILNAFNDFYLFALSSWTFLVPGARGDPGRRSRSRFPICDQPRELLEFSSTKKTVRVLFWELLEFSSQRTVRVLFSSPTMPRSGLRGDQIKMWPWKTLAWTLSSFDSPATHHNL